MNKRIRSRVLAASIVSSTLLGSGGLLFPQRSLRAQDRPTATELLDRGSRLYDQKNYTDAKKLLTDIDPAQLPEDQRAKLSDLVTKTDVALAQAMGPNGALDAAQANLDADKLAAAATGFQALIDSPTAPADVKEKAKIQLALVKQKQADKAPAMKELLTQAQSLYDQGKLDEAQNALNTVQTVGADLGWDNNAKPALLQQRIYEKRTEMARTAGGGMAAAPPANAVAAAPPTAMPAEPASAPAPAPAPNPLDVMPGSNVAPAALPSAVEPVPTGNDLLHMEAQNQTKERDRAMTLYKEAMRHSDEALSASPPQFVQAIANAQDAIDLINDSKNDFSDIEADALRDAASRQLQNANSRKLAYDVDQEHQNDLNTAARDRERTFALNQQKKQKVAQLVSDAHRLVDVANFKEAADLLRQATVIDPQDENAKLMLRLVDLKVYDRDYESIVHRNGTETMRQNVDSAEHLVPYADLMIYPDNWLEITRKRIGGDSGQDSAANRTARERLEENLHEISADQTGLEKVFNFLRENTNTNIFVNWKALEAAGIDRNTPVSISLREVPFRKALTTILSEVGGGTANLGYTIDDGIITISTRDDLNSAKYQLVRVFDIRDLLVQPQNRQAPSLSLGSSGQSTTVMSGGQGGGQGSQGGQNGGQNGGSNGGIFGSQSSTNQTQQDPTMARAAVVTNITDTIKSTVAPDSWRDNGGQIGSIRELNGQLIVNQTVDNQLEVQNLLQQLRETRAIQIAIEARLLLVSNNFLDDFRVGWDLTLPSSAIGSSIPGGVEFGNLNTFNQAIPQQTGVPGSITGAVPNPSLSLSASIIDNWTLSLLLTATQADKRTVTVTAPRVTIFNGQSGFIAVTNQQNYVQSSTQNVAAGGINGGGAVGTTLTIGTLNTGVTLQVEATVSSDRRYVVMNIDPQLSTLDGIDTFTAGTGTTTGSNTTGNNTTGSNTTTTTGGGSFVQLPKISATEVSTMVSIPDGGTLLIGGQKLVGEAEIEVGVPVLSKIPGLNRLFTNRSYVKDERTLLVLVRPNIIIHREIETDLFGKDYDKPTGLPGNTGSLPSGAGSTILPGGM